MGENDSMRAVAVAANGDVWLVGDGALLVAKIWAVGPEGVATHTRDGRTFKPAQTAANLDHLVATSSGALIGAGEYGSIVVHP